MSQEMQEYSLQKELTFYSPHLAITLQAIQLAVQSKDTRWLSWQLTLETDYEGWEKLSQAAFFGDKPENRLVEGEVEFRENKPVLLKIALKPELYEFLPKVSPASNQELPSLFWQVIGGRADLLNEAGWLLHQAWQEIKLDPSIGGGTIMVGYQTVWSPPKNEIEKLKRQGPISKTIVEAFIENSLPVRYNEATAAFEVTMVTNAREYLCYFYPQNADYTLKLKVFLEPNAPTDVAQTKELLAQMDNLVPFGSFEVENQKFCYQSIITVTPELLNDNFIVETLHAALTIAYQADTTILNN